MGKLVIGIIIVAVLVGVFAFSFNDSLDLSPSKNVKTNYNVALNGSNVSIVSNGSSSYLINLPDLTANLSIINVLNNSVNGSVQFLINYSITYKNIGNVASSNVTAFSGNSMSCNGGWGSGGGGSSQIPALNPNQIITYPTYKIMSCYGLWSANAMVDSTNALSELREDNNNANISISI